MRSRKNYSVENMITWINEHRDNIKLKPVSVTVYSPLGEYKKGGMTKYEDDIKAQITINVFCEDDLLVSYKNWGAIHCFLRGMLTAFAEKPSFNKSGEYVGAYSTKNRQIDLE